MILSHHSKRYISSRTFLSTNEYLRYNRTVRHSRHFVMAANNHRSFLSSSALRRESLLRTERQSARHEYEMPRTPPESRKDSRGSCVTLMLRMQWERRDPVPLARQAACAHGRQNETPGPKTAHPPYTASTNLLRGKSAT